jgi:hypothetical protein
VDQILGRSSEDILNVPRQGGKNLTTAERRAVDHSERIPGWGSDLDPSVRPGVPRDKAPEIGGESLYLNIETQPYTVKVMKSTEHGRMPPVFGTSCPPRGLSGWLRDVAFRFSEGRLVHWILLMLADRIDMLEGLALDLLHLRLPNILREMGLLWRQRLGQTGRLVPV